MDGFSTEWVAGWLAGCYIGGAQEREGKKIACAYYLPGEFPLPSGFFAQREHKTRFEQRYDGGLVAAAKCKAMLENEKELEWGF